MESNDTPRGYDGEHAGPPMPDALSPARAAALDAMERMRRAGYSFHLGHEPMITEILDLAFEAHAAKGIASMYAAMGMDDEDLPPDGDDGEPHQVGAGGETLAGRLDVTDKGLRFRVG